MFYDTNHVFPRWTRTSAANVQRVGPSAIPLLNGLGPDRSDVENTIGHNIRQVRRWSQTTLNLSTQPAWPIDDLGTSPFSRRLSPRALYKRPDDSCAIRRQHSQGLVHYTRTFSHSSSSNTMFGIPFVTGNSRPVVGQVNIPLMRCTFMRMW